MPMENNKKQLIHDFTTGPLLRHLVLFALPFMASNALQILYSIVDMMVVGHYVGKNGLAAVAVSSQTFNLMVMLCAGTSQGGQIMLSQMIGNGQRQRLGVAIGTLFTLLLGAGVVVTAIGVVFARQILHLLNTPADIFDDALSYTLVCCWGIVFAYGYNIVSAIMRGLGDSRHPFIFILIASVINVVLDLLFVACFHWGVFGAGLATILGQAFSFLYAVRFLYKHREETGFDFMLHSFRIEKQCLKGLLKLGLPLACRFSIVNFSMLFVIAMVASTGSAALGTFGAGTKLDDVANKMSLGVMMALTGIVAQNYGARNFARIRKAVGYTLLLSSGFYAVFAALMWFFPEQLFSIFTSDRDILDLSHTFSHAIMWTFPGLLLLKGSNGFIHGIGHSWLGMVLGIFDGFVLRIGCSWYFGTVLGWGFYGYVLGYGIAPWGSAFPGILYFLFAPWEKRKLAFE